MAVGASPSLRLVSWLKAVQVHRDRLRELRVRVGCGCKDGVRMVFGVKVPWQLLVLGQSAVLDAGQELNGKSDPTRVTNR